VLFFYKDLIFQLDRDFKKKYPDKDLALLLEWEIFIPLLKQLLKAEVKDSYGKTQLKKLEKLNDGRYFSKNE